MDEFFRFVIGGAGLVSLGYGTFFGLQTAARFFKGCSLGFHWILLTAYQGDEDRVSSHIDSKVSQIFTRSWRSFWRFVSCVALGIILLVISVQL